MERLSMETRIDPVGKMSRRAIFSLTALDTTGELYRAIASNSIPKRMKNTDLERLMERLPQIEASAGRGV